MSQLSPEEYARMATTVGDAERIQIALECGEALFRQLMRAQETFDCGKYCFDHEECRDVQSVLTNWRERVAPPTMRIKAQ